MQGMLNFLAQPIGLLTCLGALAAGCILLMALLFHTQKKHMGARLAKLEAALEAGLHGARDSANQERQADREALGANLRGMGDSLVRIMGEMGRTQQNQLDSFGGQIRATNQQDEERMERMQRGLQERLTAYDGQMVRITNTLDEKLGVNERRLLEMRKTLEEGLHLMQGQNEKKLEQIRLTVDEKLNATLDKRLGESFRTVSERLEQVYKGLGEMQTLAVGVGDLKKVLTNVSTRGTWGEVQLGALLEQVMAPGQYEQNVTIKSGSGERVEYAICLPGKEASGRKLYLPIDAKFPMEDYRRLLAATDSGDKAAIAQAGKALSATILGEARRIQGKYIDPPATTDFAILFLPVEGLFAEVLRQEGMLEKLQSQYRVIITGPTTLLALLSSLQMGFRTLAIERRSSEVWELLGAVKTEFGRFADLLTKTQQRLHQASASIEDAARKTRTIQRRLQNVQELSEREAREMIGGEDGKEQGQMALPGPMDF